MHTHRKRLAIERRSGKQLNIFTFSSCLAFFVLLLSLSLSSGFTCTMMLLRCLFCWKVPSTFDCSRGFFVHERGHGEGVEFPINLEDESQRAWKAKIEFWVDSERWELVELSHRYNFFLFASLSAPFITRFQWCSALVSFRTKYEKRSGFRIVTKTSKQQLDARV